MREKPTRRKVRHEESFWETLRSVPLLAETAWFLVFSAGDMLMTWLLLSRGGHYESNRLARWFLHNWGMAGMMTFKLGMSLFVVILSQIIAREDRDKARWVLQVGYFIIGLVVIYSLFLYICHVRGV